MVCEKCARALPDGWTFCMHCGGRAVPGGRPGLCPKCGLDVPDIAAYCKRCGARLSAAAPPDLSASPGPDKPAGLSIPPERPEPPGPPVSADGASLWPSAEAAGLERRGGEGIPTFVWWLIGGTVLFAAIMVVVIAALLSGSGPVADAGAVGLIAEMQRQFDAWRGR